MNERHRQNAFKSPIELPELELDLDRLLWIPGRKKIFIPSAPKPAFDWGVGLTWETIRPVTIQKLGESLDFQRECFRRLQLGGFDTRYCDCVPSREYLGLSREIVVPVQVKEGTWAGVERSAEPNFRSRRVDRYRW